MLASGAIAAFAPNYTILMIGRALIGIVIGGLVYVRSHRHAARACAGRAEGACNPQRRRPFLESVTHVDVSTLSLLLLLMGVTGLIGTFVVGGILRDHLNLALIVMPLLMGVLALGLVRRPALTGPVRGCPRGWLGRDEGKAAVEPGKVEEPMM